MDKSIMTECYADTLLIEILVPSENGYNYKHNCFKVEGEMKNSERFAVGVIDKDKRKIGYLNSFEVIDLLEGSLILWKQSEKAQYIIQICPALEKWILRICIAEKIDVAKHGLPNELKELMKYTKSRASIDDNRLKSLFKEISSRSDCVDVRKFKHWLRLLKEKNYTVDLNALKNA